MHDRADEELEIKSLGDILVAGTYIGEGCNGAVYQVGDVAFKIYHEYNPENNPAERAARYWNQIYKEIHHGHFAHLATAEWIDIPKSGGGFCHVLITPFINASVFDISDKDYKKFRKECKSLSIPLDMADLKRYGNVRKTKEGLLLPIDFDFVYTLPERTGCCSYSYKTPPSPKSLDLAKRFYTFLKVKTQTETSTSNSPEESVELRSSKTIK